MHHGGKRHGGSYNEYVNYDWEDARERDLRDRDGRESYFRTRYSHFLCDKCPSCFLCISGLGLPEQLLAVTVGKSLM